MKKLLLLLPLVVSCSAPADSRRDWPVIPRIPPAPPERVLRIPPDVTFRNHAEGKEYFLRLYSDPGFREEIVTVIDRGAAGQGERLATSEEHRYAMTVFEQDWKRQGNAERLRVHAELYEREKRRNATLLDQEIRLTREAVTLLEGRKFDLDADLRARKATGSGQSPEEIAFLQKEADRTAAEILERTTQLQILEHKLLLEDGSPR